MRPIRHCRAVFRPPQDSHHDKASRSRKAQLSRRDNSENGLEFVPPSANTHWRQKPNAELQIHLKLSHMEGECALLKLSRLLWVVIATCAFLALGNEHAEAKVGLASWYGPGFKGLPTASGEPFDPQGYTAAHQTLALGTELVVTYGGRSVEVTVNDRGPYGGARELDLSRVAARDLGLTRVGVDYVEYTRADHGYAAHPYDAGYSGANYSTGTRYFAHSARQGYPLTDQVGASGGGVYLVQSGDTLSGIAAELGTTAAYLAAANGIANPDIICAGQTLYY